MRQSSLSRHLMNLNFLISQVSPNQSTHSSNISSSVGNRHESASPVTFHSPLSLCKTKSSTPTWSTTPLIFARNGAHTAAKFKLPVSCTFTSGSQIRSSMSSLSPATCSTNEPIVQKRREVGDGGESVIPPARTQCFSKSARDLELSAARKPCVTAIMAAVSSDSNWIAAPVRERFGNDQHIVDGMI